VIQIASETRLGFAVRQLVDNRWREIMVEGVLYAPPPPQAGDGRCHHQHTPTI
jgi:hypothetical protein